jgi:hypothetical protein
METNNFLNILKGEKLSSVIFVMDYLQLDFNGNRLTLNLWPIVSVNNSSYKYGDQFYRDQLCSFITKKVSDDILKIDEVLILKFNDQNSIKMLLHPTNPEICTPEILDFRDTAGNLYVL